MTLTEHIRYTATSDLKRRQRERFYRVQKALGTYRNTPEMTPEFAAELLVSIGVRDDVARQMVAWVKR